MSSLNKNPEEAFSNSLLAEGFLKHYISSPQNNALHIEGRYYSYRELMSVVYNIWQQIKNTGTNFERIGIYGPDNVYTYASILAVSLYGAAYVPLNPKFPSARNKTMAIAANLPLIIVTANDEGTSVFASQKIILTGEQGISNAIFDNDLKTLQLVNQPLAYILFTSGTTGDPKGVPVSNKNVSSFFRFFTSEHGYDFSSSDRFLQVYELSFDVSVFSFFMPLNVGACCYVLPEKGAGFVSIIKMLKENKITVLSMVPTVLNYISDYIDELRFPNLRYSFFSGDALMHSLAVKWKSCIPNAEIHNFYGPTETTIVCTRYLWNEENSATESVNGIVPLGTPFPEMEFLITNENQTPAALNEIGELCFSGAQVIDNYLNNSNSDSFFYFEEKKFYRTGDLASLYKKGNLVFHGRNDSQVKINGYRIELTEVEEHLRLTTGCRSIVLGTQDKNGLDYLCAFLEAKNHDEKTVKKKLAETLPAYMIPKKIIFVDKIPTSINHKTNKAELLQFINVTNDRH